MLRAPARPSHPGGLSRPRVIAEERRRGDTRVVGSAQPAEDEHALGLALLDEHAAGVRRGMLVDELQGECGVAYLERAVRATQKPSLRDESRRTFCRHPGGGGRCG